MGWAMDGFGIYAYQDVGGNAPVVDECGGHFGPTDTGEVAYHYHSRTIVPYHLACQESLNYGQVCNKHFKLSIFCRAPRSAAAPKLSRGPTSATRAAARTCACSPARSRTSCESTLQSGMTGGWIATQSTTIDS